MPGPEIDKITLSIPPRIEHLHLVQAAVEKTGVIAGLSKTKTLNTALAVEEIFCYLCSEASRDERIDLIIDFHGYYMHAGFQFSIDEDNYTGLNLICKGRQAQPTGPIQLNLLSFDDSVDTMEEDFPDLAGIGLLLASRSVDRMWLEKKTEDRLEISLIQEKEYPEKSSELLKVVSFSLPYSVSATPSAVELRKAAALTTSKYHKAMYPGSLSQPGKLADAVINKQMGACVALDTQHNPAGLMCWHRYNVQSIAFYGPYVFSDDDQEKIAHQLADRFLELLAPRNDVMCVFSLRTTPELPEELFIRLGGVHLAGPSHGIVLRPAYFSYMPAENPAEVWAHPELTDYLKNEYGRLGLVRNIHYSREEDEGNPVNSVISAEIDREQGEVILRPLWGGDDVSDNVIDHVETLKRENIPNVFFHMDLAHSYQAHFTPALIENGFSPKLIIPYAGDLDILVFQHEYAV